MQAQQEKRFDVLVFIGRFQPFHLAHKEVIDIALSMSRQVLLILGSAQDERSIKNPFSVAERKQMILASFAAQAQQRLIFVPIIDLYNNARWCQAVKSAVAEQVKPEDKVGLIGHFKDESSYYLRLFPEWPLVELDNLKNALSATPLRAQYYQGEINQDSFPAAVKAFLTDFQQSTWYPKLQQAYKQADERVILP